MIEQDLNFESARPDRVERKTLRRLTGTPPSAARLHRSRCRQHPTLPVSQMLSPPSGPHSKHRSLAAWLGYDLEVAAFVGSENLSDPHCKTFVRVVTF